MLQAISYAGMITHWQPSDFLQLLNDDQQDALLDFLDVEPDDINKQQHLVLITEAYDYALLISAEWLSEQYGVSVTCCRLEIQQDVTTDSEYLSCTSIYPAAELYITS